MNKQKPFGYEKTNWPWWRFFKCNDPKGINDWYAKNGFTPDQIGKIGGCNFFRVFDSATAGHG